MRINLTMDVQTGEDIAFCLEHALNCVRHEPQRYTDLQVDESDEMYDDFDLQLSRSE